MGLWFLAIEQATLQWAPYGLPVATKQFKLVRPEREEPVPRI